MMLNRFRFLLVLYFERSEECIVYWFYYNVYSFFFFFFLIFLIRNFTPIKYCIEILILLDALGNSYFGFLYSLFNYDEKARQRWLDRVRKDIKEINDAVSLKVMDN